MEYIDNMKKFKSMVFDLVDLGYGRWDPELELWHSVFTDNQYRNLSREIKTCAGGRL